MIVSVTIVANYDSVTFVAIYDCHSVTIVAMYNIVLLLQLFMTVTVLLF